MTSTLQSHQISETTDYQTQREPSISRSTLSAVDISTSDIIDDNNEHISADHSDDTIEDLKTATAHNQKVIECQWLQLWHIQQEIEYEDNQRELRELSQHLKKGSQFTVINMINSENNADSTHELQHWATTDIAPSLFQYLIKLWEPHLYAEGTKGSRWQLQKYLNKINQSWELISEQFSTEWDFIVWADIYLEKTVMSDWQKQKKQHNHIWVIYINYLKVLKKNLFSDKDNDEWNIIIFNAAESCSNNIIIFWYNRLLKLYHFLSASHKEISETLIWDCWWARLSHHILTELQCWDSM